MCSGVSKPFLCTLNQVKRLQPEETLPSTSFGTIWTVGHMQTPQTSSRLYKPHTGARSSALPSFSNTSGAIICVGAPGGEKLVNEHFLLAQGIPGHYFFVRWFLRKRRAVCMGLKVKRAVCLFSARNQISWFNSNVAEPLQNNSRAKSGPLAPERTKY